MSAGWMFSDTTLWEVLGAWLETLPDGTLWYVDLFVNNVIPVPGDTFSDFDPPSQTMWPGYVNQTVNVDLWSQVQVVDHVAQSTQPNPVLFNLGPVSSPVTVYGYMMADQYANLIDAESFTTPLVVQPLSGLYVSPRLLLAIIPPTDMVRRKRGRPRKVPPPAGLVPKKRG